MVSASFPSATCQESTCVTWTPLLTIVCPTFLAVLRLSGAHTVSPNPPPFYKANEDRQLPLLLENANPVRPALDSIEHVHVFHHKDTQVAHMHFCWPTTSSVFSVYTTMHAVVKRSATTLHLLHDCDNIWIEPEQ